MLCFRGFISDVDRYPAPGNTTLYNCFVGPRETSCFIPPSYPHHLVLIYRSTPHFRSEPHFVFSARDKIITACPVQSTSFESQQLCRIQTHTLFLLFLVFEVQNDKIEIHQHLEHDFMIRQDCDTRCMYMFCVNK